MLETFKDNIGILLIYIPMVFFLLNEWTSPEEHFAKKTLKGIIIASALSLALFLASKIVTPDHPDYPRTQQTHRTPPTDPAKKYWIHNKTRKTHNYTCQYYLNCDGRYSSTGSGDNCLICGGEIEEE